MDNWARNIGDHLRNDDPPHPDRRRPAPKADGAYRLDDLQPLRDRLIVAPLAVASRSLGGIHLVETGTQRERPQHGIVLKAGPGAWHAPTQSVVPLQVQVGDCIFYGKYSGQEFVVGDRSILNMAEIEVFSILPAGTFVVVEHDDPKHNHLQGDYCDICATPAEKEARAALDAERARLVAERAGAAGVQELRDYVDGQKDAPAATLIDPKTDKPVPVNPLEQERERLREARRANDAKGDW